MTPDQTARYLRQMIAALEAERQALAALDLEALVAASDEKQAICTHLAPVAAMPDDGECRALAESARAMNEINRRVRNLLAAQVAARIDGLAGEARTYSASRAA
ncbi:MAG: flagellar protein FlgN [Sphingomonadaceae bacterium]